MFETVLSDVTISGKWTATVTDAEGSHVTSVDGNNVICTNGKDYLASFLYSATTAAATWTMFYVGVGTDATTEAAANTALGTEVGRQTGTASYTSGGIYVVVASFGAGSATGAIVEYGLFSSNTGGTMLSRDTEAVINVGASDTLTVTTEVTFA